VLYREVHQDVARKVGEWCRARPQNEDFYTGGFIACEEKYK